MSATPNQSTLWSERYAAMVMEWSSLSSTPVNEWDALFDALREQEASLRARGLWRTGGRTLLRELWLHHSEVHLCRGLAWLLTPDGWHGLGAQLLSRLLNEFNLGMDDSRAVVTTEEARETTRADVVIRIRGATLLIEAKVFAGEQPEQADRLARLWADENPTLVYLTRTGATPETAIESASQWRTLTWRRLAHLADDAARAAENPSYGALDFIQTLEEYGGSST